MTTQREADLTLAHHQHELLKNDNLSYLSVVPRLDENGHITRDYYIEAGVVRLDIQEDTIVEGVRDTSDNEEPVPPRLPIPAGSDSRTSGTGYVAVEVIESGEITALSFTESRRPCEGGNSVGNPRYKNAGTLGAPITIRGDSSNLYFLSNWHVLAGEHGRWGDPLIQPGHLDGGLKHEHKIGSLHWFALNANLDAAIGKADRRDLLKMGTRCFGNLAGMARAEVGMEVKKCGRTSRDTNGRIRSVNATARVRGYPTGTRVFTNQIQTTSMLRRGDSGSILIDGSSKKVIGLGFAGGESQSFHNHIGNISSATTEVGSVTSPDGIIEKLSTFEIEGFIVDGRPG